MIYLSNILTSYICLFLYHTQHRDNEIALLNKELDTTREDAATALSEAEHYKAEAKQLQEDLAAAQAKIAKLESKSVVDIDSSEEDSAAQKDDDPTVQFEHDPNDHLAMEEESAEGAEGPDAGDEPKVGFKFSLSPSQLS